MSKYYVTTDQTADFPPQFVEDNFAIIPMTYVVDGVLYDGENTPFLSAHEFYTLISEGKNSSTSMVSVEYSTKFFEEILKQGFDILHISFSSALSGCYDGYLQAAEKLRGKYPDRKILIVDSKCASVGEGLLVYYTLKKRATGANIDECFAYSSELRDHIGHAFTVNDMFHLYRGGRVTKTAALLGNTMRIKPVLMVSDKGELIPTNKVFGRRPAIHELVVKMQSKGSTYNNEIIFIAHGDCIDDANILAKMVTETFGEQNIVITDIGPVIGSHCGKGVLALFFLASDKIPFIK